MRERWIAVGVAVAGALLVIAGAFSDSWLVSGDLDYPSAAGLWSVERCDPGGCDRADHPSTFGAIAAVCFWIGMAAAATLLVAAAIAARGRRITRAISPEGTAIVASLAALAAAIAALVSQPYATLQLGTGPGFLIFSVGAALGLLGGILLGRLPRDDADYFSPPFDPV